MKVFLITLGLLTAIVAGIWAVGFFALSDANAGPTSCQP